MKRAGSQTGADLRLGEAGHPAPLVDKAGAGFNSKSLGEANHHRLAEFPYPILPKHRDGANWFYWLPEPASLCMPAGKIHADYLGAVPYGNFCSLDVGPDYKGRWSALDVKIWPHVGESIRSGSSAVQKQY